MNKTNAKKTRSESRQIIPYQSINQMS